MGHRACIMANQTATQRPIWSGPGSPTGAIAERFGIQRGRAKKALHDIKLEAGLDPRDNVIIYENGDVTTKQGDWIGNIKEEAGV